MSAESKGVRVSGTRGRPAVKIVPIYRPKIYEQGQNTVIEGYANTKNRPDRYGDVPAVYPKLRDYVYDCAEFLKNPVLMIDHVNAVDHVAGSVVDVHEDETGLFFRAVFSASDYPVVAHARQVYAEGHARGISMAGQFLYENPQSPEQLTLARIYEISLVAVPADPNALAEAMKKAMEAVCDGSCDENTRASRLLSLKSAIDRWTCDMRRRKAKTQPPARG
ncbi:MAG: HK97 family phage prohead protease [Elusimicrobiales bacterium]